MDPSRLSAASGTLALHAVVLAAVLTVNAPLPPSLEPVQVTLIAASAPDAADSPSATLADSRAQAAMADPAPVPQASRRAEPDPAPVLQPEPTPALEPPAPVTPLESSPPVAEPAPPPRVAEAAPPPSAKPPAAAPRETRKPAATANPKRREPAQPRATPGRELRRPAASEPPAAQGTPAPSEAVTMPVTPQRADRGTDESQASDAAPAPAARPQASESVAAASETKPAQAKTAEPRSSGPRIDASWRGNTPPPYPGAARRMGDEGEVRLDVHVGADGRVLEIRLEQSSGSSLLDRTAIETVKRWRFHPATVDGQPVAAWYHDWRWIFRLEG